MHNPFKRKRVTSILLNANISIEHVDLNEEVECRCGNRIPSFTRYLNITSKSKLKSDGMYIIFDVKLCQTCLDHFMNKMIKEDHNESYQMGMIS